MAGGVHVARFEHRLHVLVDQGEQQTTDVAAVDIGITQDHDAAITAVVEVEVATGASADGCEQGLGLGVVEDLLLAGLGRIDHLAPQRQDRHGLGVAPSLAGPAAESPSTRMISESGPCVRQSASFSGMPVEPSFAALRLFSRTCLDATRF